MPLYNPSRTFCVVEALNPPADAVLHLAHNTKYRITTRSDRRNHGRQRRLHESLRNAARRHAAGSIEDQDNGDESEDDYESEDDLHDFPGYPRPRLALTLDEAYFHRLQNGLLFGCNDRDCDILLDANNELGISEHHFRIQWLENFSTDEALLIRNESHTQAVTVNRSILQNNGDQQLLCQEGYTFVEVGLMEFRVFIPDRTPRQQKKFDAKWQRFVRFTKHNRPIAPASDGRRFHRITNLPNTVTLFDRPHVQYERLGTGCSGQVYRCILVDSKQVFAKKKIDIELWRRSPRIQREAFVLRDLGHPSIVGYHGKKEADGFMEIYMEFARFGDLLTYRNRADERRLNQDVVKNIALQTLQGLAYLHGSYVFHRDVKMQNILVFSETPVIVKLADFGFSRKWQPGDVMSMNLGTPGFIAPEILWSQPSDDGSQGYEDLEYDGKADIFSLGVTLWSILLGSGPFQVHSDMTPSQMRQMVTTPLDFGVLNAIAPQAVGLLSKMLAISPLDRPTALECLEDAWFEGLPMVATHPSSQTATSRKRKKTPTLAEHMAAVRGLPDKGKTPLSTIAQLDEPSHDTSEYTYTPLHSSSHPATLKTSSTSEKIQAYIDDDLPSDIRREMSLTDSNPTTADLRNNDNNPAASLRNTTQAKGKVRYTNPDPNIYRSARNLRSLESNFSDKSVSLGAVVRYVEAARSH